MTVSVRVQDIMPLQTAAQNGDLQTAQSLLAHGADVNAKESEVLRLFSHTVESSLSEGPQSLSTYLFLVHIMYLLLFRKVLSPRLHDCTG